MCQTLNDNHLTNQHQLLRDRGICVVIPTYNNVGTINDVVARAKLQCADVIVVSDGCTDGTLERLKETKGIVIVDLTVNKGKGYALKAGFEKALELGFSYAVTLDADGQHFPEDIPLLVESNIRYPGAVIVGERKDLEKAERSAGSKFANKFSNFWFFVQTGKALRDTQTGFRLYPLKKLYGLRFLTSRYEAELELLVFASWHGVNIVSTPVNVYYPPRHERVSHFRPGPDFTRISVLNTVLCILAVIYGAPLRIFRQLRKVFYTAYALIFFVFISMFVLTPFTWIYMKLNGHNDRSRRVLRRALYAVAKFVMIQHTIPGVKFRKSNESDEKFATPAIVVCNHQSHLDLMAILSLTPEIVFFTNDWVWNSPFFGYVIRKAGYISASSGMEQARSDTKRLLDQGVSVVIFPEGTRSSDCEIKRFHKGAFHLALELGSDIVPVLLYGAGKVLPKGAKWLCTGRIDLEVGTRIPNSEIPKMGETTKEITSCMKKYYQKWYYNRRNEIERNV